MKICTLQYLMIRGMEGKGFFRDSQDRKDFVTCLEDLSKQTAIRILAWSLPGRVRAKITWILRREYGIATAEIARQLGVCTSAIAKAIRKREREDLMVLIFPYVPQSIYSLVQYFLTFFPVSWILPILRFPHDLLRGYQRQCLSEQFQAFLIGERSKIFSH